MKKYLAWGAFFLPILILGGFAQGKAVKKGVVPVPAPQPIHASAKQNKLFFSFPDLAGKKVSLTDTRFIGKAVAVVVWGTWSPGCRQQVATLKRLSTSYGKKGLEIVAIAFEPPMSNALQNLQEFTADNQINYTVLAGGSRYTMAQKLSSALNLRVIPTVFFVGRDGLVKSVEEGFNPTTSPITLEAKALEVLNPPVAAAVAAAPPKTAGRIRQFIQLVGRAFVLSRGLGM